MSARPSPALTRALEALIDQLSPTRRDGLERLLELGLPTPRDDAFRYSNLRILDRRNLVPVTGVSNALPEGLALGGSHLVFVNGVLDSDLSHLSYSYRRQTSARQGQLPGSAIEDRLRLLNAALGAEHTQIVVPRDTEVSLDIVMLATGGGAYPSLSILLEPFAKLNLTEHHASADDGESVTVAAIDIQVSDQACLNHTVVQVSGPRHIVMEDVRVNVVKDATYRHRSAVLGAQLSRIDLTVNLDAAGANTELAGIFLTDGAREHHLRTVVHHKAPNCSSQQLYRGVANERGRGSYDGKVIVDAGANGTNSAQSSKNLLLSGDASIETRPQLEINADAVKCAHGATTGSLDEKMMFYLLSRGLDRDTARAVLTYAFLGDVLAGFETNTRAFVEERALGRLPAADLIRGFVA